MVPARERAERESLRGECPLELPHRAVVVAEGCEDMPMKVRSTHCVFSRASSARMTCMASVRLPISAYVIARLARGLSSNLDLFWNSSNASSSRLSARSTVPRVLSWISAPGFHGQATGPGSEPVRHRRVVNRNCRSGGGAERAENGARRGDLRTGAAVLSIDDHKSLVLLVGIEARKAPRPFRILAAASAPPREMRFRSSAAPRRPHRRFPSDRVTSQMLDSSCRAP